MEKLIIISQILIIITQLIIIYDRYLYTIKYTYNHYRKEIIDTDIGSIFIINKLPDKDIKISKLEGLRLIRSSKITRIYDSLKSYLNRGQ